MKRAALLWIVFAILSTVHVGVGGSEETQTLKGDWVWNHRDNAGSLEAIFTSSGDGTWDVAFHFTFRGKPRVFSGTAEGSLSDGALRGTVQDAARERTFNFRGSFEEGGFQGTHAEIEDGEEHETGTLTLER